jgi:hypothetical protein
MELGFLQYESVVLLVAAAYGLGFCICGASNL